LAAGECCDTELRADTQDDELEQFEEACGLFELELEFMEPELILVVCCCEPRGAVHQLALLVAGLGPPLDRLPLETVPFEGLPLDWIALE